MKPVCTHLMIKEMTVAGIKLVSINKIQPVQTENPFVQ